MRPEYSATLSERGGIAKIRQSALFGAKPSQETAAVDLSGLLLLGRNPAAIAAVHFQFVIVDKNDGGLCYFNCAAPN